MIAKFKIDSEFRSLLIPLSKDEADQLEKNVLNAGTILEPLVVWQQQEILLDGHHRYDLAMKHGLAFNVAAISLLDRDAAIQWIIDNQLGRRNLTAEQASYLRGQEYARQKAAHGDHSRFSQDSPASCQNDTLGRTALKVAERHRVSPRTVHRDASFAKAVDNIGEKVGPSTRDKILSGDLKLTKQEVKSVAAMEPEKAKAVVQEIESGRATREMIADVQNSDLTVKDSTGNVVPEMLRQTFQHATELQDMMVGIDAMLRGLKAISQTSAGCLLDLQDVSMHLRHARKDIRFAMPFAICPNCKAKQPNCQACKGRGWLTERAQPTRHPSRSSES